MAKSIIYLRSSSSPKMSIEKQEEDCRKLAADKELPPIEGVYTDRAVSGRRRVSERPAGSQMLQALYKGDHLIVAKHDRLGRNLADILSVIQDLDARGVEVHFVNFLNLGNLQRSTPIGELIFNVLMAVAEFERSLGQERAIESAAYAREHGLPRGKPQYGKSHIRQNGKVIVVDNPKEQQAIARILVLYREGKSDTDIMRIVNAEGHRTRWGTKFKARVIKKLRLTHSGEMSLQEAKAAAYGARYAVGYDGLKYRTAHAQKTLCRRAHEFSQESTYSGQDNGKPQDVGGD